MIQLGNKQATGRTVDRPFRATFPPAIGGKFTNRLRKIRIRSPLVTGNRASVLQPVCSSENGNGRCMPTSEIDFRLSTGLSGSEDPMLLKISGAQAMTDIDSLNAIAALPLLKLLLLSDGSLTRHLQVLSGQPIQANPLGPATPVANPIPTICSEFLTGPLVRRQVLLSAKNSQSEPLVFAESFWEEDKLQSVIRDWNQPIGEILNTRKMETHREILELFRGQGSAELVGMLGGNGVYSGRTYVLLSGGVPLCVIHEVMSSHLEELIAHLSDRNGFGGNGNGRLH